MPPHARGTNNRLNLFAVPYDVSLSDIPPFLLSQNRTLKALRMLSGELQSSACNVLTIHTTRCLLTFWCKVDFHSYFFST